MKGRLPRTPYLEGQKPLYLLQDSPLGKLQNLERLDLGMGGEKSSLSKGFFKLEILIYVAGEKGHKKQKTVPLFKTERMAK